MAVNKPNKYDETPAGGEFTPVELGGHYMVIKQAAEKQSKNGNPMVVVLVDFDQNDRQAGYFEEQFRNDIRPDKKWPNQATIYIVTEDRDGNCTKGFKTFTTCVEHSNKGFSIPWGEKFCQSMKGKKVGSVFGIVEEEYNGEIRKRRKHRWFCSVDRVKDAEIPEEKLLSAAPPLKSPADADGFLNIPDGIDEELPFN